MIAALSKSTSEKIHSDPRGKYRNVNNSNFSFNIYISGSSRVGAVHSEEGFSFVS